MFIWSGTQYVTPIVVALFHSLFQHKNINSWSEENFVTDINRPGTIHFYMHLGSHKLTAHMMTGSDTVIIQMA